MAWLIIGLVLAFMLAPVVWMIPSPKQKRQAAFRALAREEGLQVSMRPKPQTHRQKVRKEDTATSAFYALPMRRDKQQGNDLPWLAVRADDRWELPREVSNVEALLASFDDRVTAVEYTGLALGAYWRETGEPIVVIELANTLRQLADALGKPYGNA